MSDGRSKPRIYKVDVTMENHVTHMLSVEAYGLFCRLRNFSAETNETGLIVEPNGLQLDPKAALRYFRIGKRHFDRLFAEIVGWGVIQTPRTWLARLEEVKRPRYNEVARSIMESAPAPDAPILIPSLAEAFIERYLGQSSGRKGIDPRETHQNLRARRMATARSKGTHTEEEWRQLLKLFDSRCVRCLIPAASLEGGALTKDHVQSLRDGGTDAIDNIQPLCRHCNTAKEHEERRDWRDDLHDRLDALIRSEEGRRG